MQPLIYRVGCKPEDTEPIAIVEFRESGSFDRNYPVISVIPCAGYDKDNNPDAFIQKVMFTRVFQNEALNKEFHKRFIKNPCSPVVFEAQEITRKYGLDPILDFPWSRFTPSILFYA